MSEILLEQVFPGATTCIVIGDLDQIAPNKLQPYRHLLWWTDTAGDSRIPAEHRSERVQTADIKTAAPTLILEQFLQRDARHLPTLYVTRAALTRQTADFQRLIGEVHAVLENNHRARLTRQKDGFTWQKHLLTNVPGYIRRRVPGSWNGALRSLPAFIVGAGPSLDISAPKLAAVAAQGVIFAADSALRALARHGVTADFVISIDAAKVPEKCLPTDRLAPGLAVLSSVSPPAWQSSLPAERVRFLSSNQITEDWLATHSVARTAVSATENCGSTAIEIAQYLGCDPLYLFGLDFAVDATDQIRRHHQDAEAALYTQSNYNPATQLPSVPGNYTPAVPTFALGDWRALDERLAARTSGTIINVNDRGARLRGTTLMHPAQFALAPTAGEKTAALAHLAAATEPNPALSARALAQLRSGAEVGVRALPSLRAVWKNGGPTALAEAMRQVIIAPDFGPVLGAFALKLMPHLVPPIEGDAMLWQSLLKEFEELTILAHTGRLPSAAPD
jgi:hypothetical protein